MRRLPAQSTLIEAQPVRADSPLASRVQREKNLCCYGYVPTSVQNFASPAAVPGVEQIESKHRARRYNVSAFPKLSADALRVPAPRNTVTIVCTNRGQAPGRTHPVSAQTATSWKESSRTRIRCFRRLSIGRNKVSRRPNRGAFPLQGTSLENRLKTPDSETSPRGSHATCCQGSQCAFSVRADTPDLKTAEISPGAESKDEPKSFSSRRISSPSKYPSSQLASIPSSPRGLALIDRSPVYPPKKPTYRRHSTSAPHLQSGTRAPSKW